jgi:hypothetical protein
MDHDAANERVNERTNERTNEQKEEQQHRTPDPGASSVRAGQGAMAGFNSSYLNVTLEEVKTNFAFFGLLDEQATPTTHSLTHPARARAHACPPAHAPTGARAPTHVRTHTHTHARTHAQRELDLDRPVGSDLSPMRPTRHVACCILRHVARCIHTTLHVAFYRP